MCNRLLHVLFFHSLLSHTCCLFGPAFGCCALQTEVELAFFFIACIAIYTQIHKLIWLKLQKFKFFFWKCSKLWVNCTLRSSISEWSNGQLELNSKFPIFHIPKSGIWVDNHAMSYLQQGVDFINCFAPFAYLLHPVLSFYATKSISKVGRRVCRVYEIDPRSFEVECKNSFFHCDNFWWWWWKCI